MYTFHCVGTTVIAGLQTERNILSVEKFGINFIHQKTRAVKLLSTSQAGGNIEEETVEETVER